MKADKIILDAFCKYLEEQLIYPYVLSAEAENILAEFRMDLSDAVRDILKKSDNM